MVSKSNSISKWKSLLSESYEASSNRNWKLALKKAKAAAKIAETLKNPQKKCESLLRVAQCAFDVGNPSLVKNNISLIIAIKDSEKANQSITELLIDCAAIYFNMWHFSDAKDLLNENILRSKRSSSVTIAALFRLGSILTAEQNPSGAVVHFAEGARLAKQLKLHKQHMENLWALSNSYSLLSDNANSLNAARTSYKIAKQFGDSLQKGISLIYIAEAYYQVGNYAWAERYYLDALKLNKEDTAENVSNIHERMFPTKGHSNRWYEMILDKSNSAIDNMSKTSVNYLLFLSMLKRIVAFNGLNRYEEAQESIADILELIGTDYSTKWPHIESVLSELAITLDGLNKPEMGNKAMNIATRIRSLLESTIRTLTRKRTQLQVITKDLNDFIQLFQIGRVKVFRIRGRVINFETKTITAAKGKPSEGLTPYEITLLEYLVAHQGKNCYVIDLAAELYAGARNDPERDWRSTLKPHISNLRRKLHDDKGGSIIKFVRHIGWRLSTD